MSKQDRYIPGVPCWIDSTQPDPQAAAGFYSELFGWELADVMPAGSEEQYIVGRLGGGDVAAIGSQPQDAPAVWNSYVWVQDADETIARVRSAGGSVLSDPQAVGSAGRMAVCADPEGAAYRLWEPRDHRGAAVVNEHGSLNFNVLNTRDVAAAAAHYGAVFGWELLDVGGSPMWALPSYGDFLEARTPGMRENMAAMGAPERFEDVVAGITAPAGDEPAHWGVTFAVDDADAIAARTTELGGQVLVAPLDAPWVRMTVVQDPQGARFTASRYAPENKDLAAGAEAAAGA